MQSVDRENDGLTSAVHDTKPETARKLHPTRTVLIIITSLLDCLRLCLVALLSILCYTTNGEQSISFNFVAVTRFLAEASDEGSRDRDSHDVSIFFPLLRLHNTSQPCTQSKQLFVSLAMGRIIDLSEFSLTSSCLLC
jgi:hypothetical protein